MEELFVELLEAKSATYFFVFFSKQRPLKRIFLISMACMLDRNNIQSLSRKKFDHFCPFYPTKITYIFWAPNTSNFSVKSFSTADLDMHLYVQAVNGANMHTLLNTLCL